MSVTRPAIRARMGSTVYYETTVTARELANTVRAAKDLDSWAGSSIDERMQRDINHKRVRAELVPYLAQHADRFFGSFIVLVPKGQIEFEPLEDVAENLKAAYRKAAKDIGFLTIDKGELIALDGQHRLVAVREVIGSTQELGHFAGQVGDDEVCVLFIEFENAQKTRRIFNKVNRHAKPTGRSDNIITSEDDGFAIVTRRLLDPHIGAPLAPRQEGDHTRELVNWTSNTLTTKSERLTTISAVYEAVRDILTHEGLAEGFSETENPVAPPAARLDAAYDCVATWFEAILKLDAFKNALADPENIPEVRFSNDHRHTLLLRPVGQIALVRGLVKAMERSKGKLKLGEALRRAGKVDWSASATSAWRDTIVRADGRMVARSEAYELAAELLAYLIASEFTEEVTKHKLYNDWNVARGRDPYKDAEELKEGEVPEDLPEPVSV